MRSAFALVACLAVSLTAPCPALGHEYYAAGFTVVHPWAEATAPDARDAAVYFRLDAVQRGDRLLRAHSRFARRVELRGGDEPAAAPLPAIDFSAADSIDFGAGRPHLLMRDLDVPLQWGRSYEMTLVFEHAGPIQVMVSVGAH